MVCDHDRIVEMHDLVHLVMKRRCRNRVRVVGVSAGDLSEADQVWEGIAFSAGAPISLLFPGDVWAPDAVSLLNRSLSPDGVVYGDSDLLGPEGTYLSPRFKPDYSPDLLLSSSYIGAPLALGEDVARRLPRPRGPSLEAIEHECALGACEVAGSVHHVAEILCHRSTTESSGELDPLGSGEHIGTALRRRGDQGQVVRGRVPGTYRILRSAGTNASVSILIPFRDQPRLLRTCVDSVNATTMSHDVEFVLIDNGSTDPEVLTLMEDLDRRANVTVITDPRPFNWAELNNAGAHAARSEFLLFLNNDIEARRRGLAFCARRPRISG